MALMAPPSPSEGKSSMDLMDPNSAVPRHVSPLLAGSPLVLLRSVAVEPLGLHDTSNLVSSLDSTPSLLPYSGAHCSKHVSELILDEGFKAIACSFALWFYLALLKGQFSIVP